MKNAISILKIAIESTNKQLDKWREITDKNEHVKSVIKGEEDKIKEYVLAINILEQKTGNCNNCENYNNGYCNILKFNVSINSKWCKLFKIKL